MKKKVIKKRTGKKRIGLIDILSAALLFIFSGTLLFGDDDYVLKNYRLSQDADQLLVDRQFLSVEPVARTEAYLCDGNAVRRIKEKDFSNSISTVDNLLQDGDFSNGLGAWNIYINSLASAAFDGSNGFAGIQISNGNYESWHIQLSQGGLNLESGKVYELSFDVCTSGAIVSGEMDVHVEKNASSYIPYMPKQTVYFGPGWTNFRFTFTMSGPSDMNGRLAFNMGNFTSKLGDTGLNIDNVCFSLK